MKERGFTTIRHAQKMFLTKGMLVSDFTKTTDSRFSKCSFMRNLRVFPRRRPIYSPILGLATPNGSGVIIVAVCLISIKKFSLLDITKALGP